MSVIGTGAIQLNTAIDDAVTEIIVDNERDRARAGMLRKLFTPPNIVNASLPASMNLQELNDYASTVSVEGGMHLAPKHARTLKSRVPKYKSRSARHNRRLSELAGRNDELMPSINEDFDVDPESFRHSYSVDSFQDLPHHSKNSESHHSTSLEYQQARVKKTKLVEKKTRGNKAASLSPSSFAIENIGEVAASAIEALKRKVSFLSHRNNAQSSEIVALRDELRIKASTLSDINWSKSAKNSEATIQAKLITKRLYDQKIKFEAKESQMKTAAYQTRDSLDLELYREKIRNKALETSMENMRIELESTRAQLKAALRTNLTHLQQIEDAFIKDASEKKSLDHILKVSREKSVFVKAMLSKFRALQ